MRLLNDMFTVTGGGHDKIELRLNAGHPIYKAHFPGNPITPGVCIVQLIGELASERVGRSLRLGKIVNLKFVAPISPVDDADVEVVFTAVDDTTTACKVMGTIEGKDGLKTKFSIVYV